MICGIGAHSRSSVSSRHTSYSSPLLEPSVEDLSAHLLLKVTAGLSFYLSRLLYRCTAKHGTEEYRRNDDRDTPSSRITSSKLKRIARLAAHFNCPPRQPLQHRCLHCSHANARLQIAVQHAGAQNTCAQGHAGRILAPRHALL